MSTNPLQPPRLKTCTAGPSSVDGRLAHQLRNLSARPQIPRLRSIPHPARPSRLWLAAVRVTVAVAILLVVAGGAGATALLIIHRIRPTAPSRFEPAAAPAGTENRPRSRRSAEHPVARAETQDTDQPTLPAPAERPMPVAGPEQIPPHHPPAEQPFLMTEVAAPKILPVRLRSARLEPAPAPAPSTASIAEEATLLRQALAALRQARDGKRALELLAIYDLRFPRGTLAPEASAARAQALLLMGDKPGALAVLDQLPLEHGGQAGELHLVRGELRSLAGRCREALADFGMVLQQATGIQPEERARALYGRASCRARTGDPKGAEQDRQRYLQEYPNGPASPLLRSSP
jgi:hypothetical protein